MKSCDMSVNASLLLTSPPSPRPPSVEYSAAPQRSIKEWVKFALCGVYKYTGAMCVHERIADWRGSNYAAILLFHRVTDDIPEDGLTVNTRWFRGLCEMLKASFHVVSLGEIMESVHSGRPFHRRTVAITFDDCYRDNLFAARVLAEFGHPATFFVPTQFVGTDHVFPWDRGLRRMANLTWDEVHEMVNLGHEIGSHTVSHADFGAINPQEALDELTQSRITLEQELGKPVRWFAYPFGGASNFKPEYLPLVYEAGYHGCFSGHGGFVYPGMAGEVIPREAMPYFRSLLNLELHLSGCLDWMYSTKKKFGWV